MNGLAHGACVLSMGLKLGLLVLSVVALVFDGGVSKSAELCLVAVVEDNDFSVMGLQKSRVPIE